MATAQDAHAALDVAMRTHRLGEAYLLEGAGDGAGRRVLYRLQVIVVVGGEGVEINPQVPGRDGRIFLFRQVGKTHAVRHHLDRESTELIIVIRVREAQGVRLPVEQLVGEDDAFLSHP